MAVNSHAKSLWYTSSDWTHFKTQFEHRRVIVCSWKPQTLIPWHGNIANSSGRLMKAYDKLLIESTVELGPACRCRHTSPHRCTELVTDLYSCRGCLKYSKKFYDSVNGCKRAFFKVLSAVWSRGHCGVQTQGRFWPWLYERRETEMIIHRKNKENKKMASRRLFRSARWKLDRAGSCHDF